MGILKRLKKLAEEAKAAQSQLDISGIEDPLAKETSWEPLQRGGSNFKTHVFKQEGPDVIAFRATTGYILFSSVFFFVGIGILSLWFFLPALGEDMGWGGKIMLGLMGGLFAGVGAFLYIHGTQPTVFDKRHGYFYKGRKNTDKNSEKARVKHLVKLENIHALQVLKEYNSGSESSYYSYEINLVLKDSRRVNVIDHGNLQQVKDDASRLSEFLNVPIWDVV
ncbi:MAG: hypothetical protein AAF696_08885 [Bacteroidota bacterium]